MSRRRTISTLLVLSMVALGACSSNAQGHEADDPGDAPTAHVERPDGPAADVSGPLTGGNGINLASITPGPDLDEAGWVEEEYAAEGTATSYRSVGDLPTDGRFELEEDATADYRTRIVVRRPGDAADFNGTVAVEWLNVSGGLDAGPDYAYTADELVRGGYAWVGVSAQRIGIEGGPVAVTVEAARGVAGQGLRTLDPERYGSLHHPGDAFAYDIYTQVARALRQPGAAALGGLEPERLLAVGESQSAFALTTYVDGVQPLTLAFDGFLIHSRGGAAAPLGRPDEGIDIAGSIGGQPTQMRTDLDAPIMVVETETDVLSILNYHPARQPDSERFRLWEVAGTAHADAYLLGAIAGAVGCPKPINAGPQHFVVKAALRSLDTWVRAGEAPPEAPRLEVDEGGGSPVYQRDADGNVLGGVRTPQVDVPVATLSGEPTESASTVCLLMGSTTPLPAGRLAELYPSGDDYLDAYIEATDDAIDAGFVLEDDREALIADADPSVIPA